MALTAATHAPQDAAGGRRKSRLRLSGAVAVGAGLALAITACQGPTGSARVAGAAASGDGTLRIGLILDNTGPQNFLNAPQLAAAKLAIQEINAAGGHKGTPVVLLPETVGIDTAAQAKELVAAKADVVVGPTDSSRAPGAIDLLSNAKVTLISPANSATGLSKYKSGGYYFRTSAADVAQAPVLAKLAKDDGARTIAVMHEEGSYGRDVATAVTAAARQAGLDPVADAEFKPGEAQQAAAAAKAAAPDAVVLIAREGAQGAIAELNNVGLPGKKLILSDGAVNQYGSGLGARALEGARGILPGLFPAVGFQSKLVSVDPGLKDMAFAAETYDAVNLAAVAAAAAEDDAGTSIAAKLAAVSGGTAQASHGAQPSGEATSCRSYKDCVGALRDGKRPDYDGESGRINFDSSGDVTEANYMLYSFGADNKAIMGGSETASSSGG
ncbi:MAG: amino acid transporter substrate-binding protein [Arthrobacter sp.]|nr:amino acid transporter substrate-binding protein [Arthrobacter sp.]